MKKALLLLASFALCGSVVWAGPAAAVVPRPTSAS